MLRLRLLRIWLALLVIAFSIVFPFAKLAVLWRAWAVREHGPILVGAVRAAEALGQSPGALLQDAGTDAATVAALRTALNACESFQGEILNRAKDGRRYWLALDIPPLYGDDGSRPGLDSRWTVNAGPCT